MVIFPNCKINIGLNILDKREDGYHNLETVFIPLPLRDSLEIIHSSNDNPGVSFSQTGLTVEGNASDNLCVKAYHLLKQDFPALPAIQMHLHKTIPMGAGLGGGSADAACTLLLLNKKFQLNLSQEMLIRYALQLGSDCPFFIINQPCFGTGRGEKLQPLDLSLSGYQLLLINPGIHVNTGWAFTQLRQQDVLPRQSRQLLENIKTPINEWRHSITNDFEGPVFTAHPLLQEIKARLYGANAIYAAMSGSGSTLFGLFEKGHTPSSAFPENWFVKHLTL